MGLALLLRLDAEQRAMVLPGVRSRDRTGGAARPQEVLRAQGGQVGQVAPEGRAPHVVALLEPSDRHRRDVEPSRQGPLREPGLLAGSPQGGRGTR